MIRVLLVCALLFGALPLYGAVEGESQIVSIRLVPEARTLSGKAASQQFVVMAKTAGGRELDLTEQARFTLSDPELAAFRETGRVIAVRDGETKVRAAVGLTKLRRRYGSKGPLSSGRSAFRETSLESLPAAAAMAVAVMAA